MFSTDIGIDLGTATVLVYIKGKGIVMKEPSVVAIDKNTGNTLAVGSEARRMLGRTPGNIVALRPLKEGVISDYEVTEKMLRHFIKKAVGHNIMKKPRIAVCVPSSVTEVERRAVYDATKNAGARQVFIIEEPIAAAIGAGIDISRACGSMVVDIGGGTTDIAVISLGGCVVSLSLKVAGDNFDEAIMRYMRKKHSILIGERTAEDLKINIGTAYERPIQAEMNVRGRNLITGLPKNIAVSSDEMLEALSEPVSSIIEGVYNVLERTPPELASDISDRGIVMTGGSSLLYGLDKLIKEKTGINAIIADDSVSCVAIGTGKYIEFVTEGGVNDLIRQNYAAEYQRRY
jgi:rod shape-determining protein MreB